MSFIESVSFNEKGLVPVIAQDAADGRVLMLAWADREALLETAQSGFATYGEKGRKAETVRKSSGFSLTATEIPCSIWLNQPEALPVIPGGAAAFIGPLTVRTGR
jgi:phosphoribosyl-AMP cyclohydrolase